MLKPYDKALFWGDQKFDVDLEKLPAADPAYNRNFCKKTINVRGTVVSLFR